MPLEEAYRAWAPDLVAFAATLGERDQAADAVADVFQRLLVDPQRWATVRDPRGYLFRSVANSARANARSAGRRRDREELVWSSDRAHRDGASVQVSTTIDSSVLDALAVLSNQQRAAIFLAYWMDEPVDRVAEILGVGQGTVRRQLARARHRLRGALS